MNKPGTSDSKVDINSPAHKRKREADEPEQPIRLEEQYVPLYKAFRKAYISLDKAQHHRSKLQEFKTLHKIPKAFKIKIKPQIPNPTTEFIIEWETAASNFGHTLVAILLKYWNDQIEKQEKEVVEIKELMINIPTSQILAIESITDRLITTALQAYNDKWRKDKEEGENVHLNSKE